MIANCTRGYSVDCWGLFETSIEDANDPGYDFKGPECPACYLSRIAKTGTDHELYRLYHLREKRHG